MRLPRSWISCALLKLNKRLRFLGMNLLSLIVLGVFRMDVVGGTFLLLLVMFARYVCRMNDGMIGWMIGRVGLKSEMDVLLLEVCVCSLGPFL